MVTNGMFQTSETVEITDITKIMSVTGSVSRFQLFYD